MYFFTQSHRKINLDLIAEVDSAEFRYIGYCKPGVYACPRRHLSFSMKSAKSFITDPIEENQDLMLFYYDPQTNGPHAFEIGYFYEQKKRNNRKFVQLCCKTPVGILDMHIHFFVAVDQCSFSYKEIDLDADPLLMDYDGLLDRGLIVGK